MRSALVRFIIELASLLVVLLSVNYFVLVEMLNEKFGILQVIVYCFFLLMVTFIHISMLRALKKRPQQFVIAFMASMGIKIFVSLTLLMIIMYTGINNSNAFAINYLLLYLSFSSFSIYQMLRAQKKISGQVKN